MKPFVRNLLLSATLFGIASAAHAQAPGKRIKVAMVPKLIGLSVFKANEQGAIEAAKKLNIQFLYTGPVTASAQGQVDIINSLIARRFNVITITANNPTEPAPALERAMKQGIKVVSYDSDVAPNARDFFIQDTSYPAMGKALVDSVEKYAGPDAKIAILSSTPDATIQNAWLAAVKTYMTKTYPKMSVVTTQYGYSSPSKSLSAGLNILQAYPDVTAIIAPDGAAEVGAAAAVKKLNRVGKVFVTGCSDPNSIRQYVKDGIIKASPLWNEVKEGELVMNVARLAADNKLKPNDTFTVKGLGNYTVKNKVIVFSKPLIFTAANISQYHF
ncbi:autoinducer 2 ABC transporter substrate-binding protein [Acidiphilium acidophilum]|uniref:Autoinducer 2-binding protein LsrB n=1 Tax=Acidiphilium acidophilum TaxID=76588 RepID=A0AAW9DKK4_ACIAO|nr:substrate-binding domain-containing protein [Acidiphilium acidophilum]MDX5929578.1 substrate-binding domain-containing protein [Acidiphilium acidophilum]GBQ18832.1 putative secreted solute-binding lipoprotein [Acidiphilium acidophilum DSM 700]